MTVRILTGDCRDVLKTLPDESVHCVVTSPPYWGLRDYGTAKWEGGDPACDHKLEPSPARQFHNGGDYTGNSTCTSWNKREQKVNRQCKCGARRIDSQIGLESSYQEYIATMVEVFREVRRVLRKDGTCWVNMGDCYASSVNGTKAADIVNDDRTFRDKPFSTVQGSLKPKDLCGIPWRLAFALQDDGWWLRQDIIWAKPNPMPESVTDRCTKAHEYLFLLTKSSRYFFDSDAIREEAEYERREQPEKTWDRCKVNGQRVSGATKGSDPSVGRNRRSVWEIATAPFSEAHFATFPPALVEPCIRAGTSEKGCCAKCGTPWVREVEKSGGTIGKSWHNHENDLTRGQTGGIGKNNAARGWDTNGYTVKELGWSPSCSCPVIIDDMGEAHPFAKPCTVLDPFGGAGTTGLVADRLGRNAILIELNPEYAEMARKRLTNDAGLFADVGTYNGTDDFAKSLDVGYAAIRERVANGGPGWEPKP